jgi:hypothetical protein
MREDLSAQASESGREHADEEAWEDALGHVRSFALALPETSERLSHGTPTYFIRKKTFVHLWDDHHGDGRLAIWCAAAPGVQEQLVEQESARFFRPPYVGHRGWLGVRLDVDVDWGEVGDIIREAFLAVAPKRLANSVQSAEG